MIKKPDQKLADTLELLCKGYEVHELSNKLNRSPKSVELYIKGLKELFSVNTIIGLIVEACRYNFLYPHLEDFRNMGATIEEEDLLSDTEKIVLFELLQGKKQQQIADKLGLTLKQTQYNKRRIYEKWSVDSSSDLVIKSIKKLYLRLELNTPIINANKEQDVLEMHKTKSNRDYILAKYKLKLSSPRKILFALSREHQLVLASSMAGYDNRDMTRLLGLNIRRIQNLKQDILNILDANSIAELVITTIELGLIVIDSWLDSRMITITQNQKRFFLKASILSAYKTVDEMKVPGYSYDERIEFYTELSKLWKKRTIEALIIDGLKRGDFTIRELLREANQSINKPRQRQ